MKVTSFASVSGYLILLADSKEFLFSPCFFTLPVPVFRKQTEKMLVRMYKSFQNQVKSHLGHL